MAANSINGRFRDIEVSFTYKGTRVVMSLENLASVERQVRVMYQRLPISGRANWMDFKLIDEKQSAVIPRDVLESYRLTFFVDKHDPISTEIEKILEELAPIKDEFTFEAPPPELTTPEDSKANVNETPIENAPTQPDSPEAEATESSVEIAQPVMPTELEREDDIKAEVTPSSAKAIPQQAASERIETDIPEKIQHKKFHPLPQASFGFKIKVHTLPKSADKARRKAKALQNSVTATTPRSTQKGIFGNFANAFGLAGSVRRNRAYYREEGERTQIDTHARIAKLEKDYVDGYGFFLGDWESENLTEEENAIFLLNLMVNEIGAWQKDTGTAPAKSVELSEILADIEKGLRHILKQIRSPSVPSPTLLAKELIAENQQDLEKIRTNCNAYIHRFSTQLVELDKSHAQKIEILTFKKFLVEFIRDKLFLNIAKCIHPSPMPERLNWFLELLDYEIIPIEIGKTKFSRRYHKLSGIKESEFEPGAIVEVLCPGLQSRDGKRVVQTAVVIQSE